MKLNPLQLSNALCAWDGCATDFTVINGILFAIERHHFHYDVIGGLTTNSHAVRYCFDSLVNARRFLKDHDGQSMPVIGLNGCVELH